MVDQITTADDRRHGVSHMSEYLSIRDLINQVKEKIPEDSPIPSVSTVIYSFAAPNMYAKIVQYYTGKTNLTFVVQRHQLHAYHTVMHTGAMLCSDTFGKWRSCTEANPFY